MCAECGLDPFGPHRPQTGHKQNPETGAVSRVVGRSMIDAIIGQRKALEESRITLTTPSREICDDDKKRRRTEELKDATAKLRVGNQGYRDQRHTADQRDKLEGRHGRGKLQFDLREHWWQALRGPDLGSASSTDVHKTLGKFGGDRPDLKEVHVRRPLSREELRSFRTSISPARSERKGKLKRGKAEK